MLCVSCQLFGGRPQHVMFFDKDKRPLIVPHELNFRHQDQVERKYTNSLRRFGNVPGVRGEPWFQVSQGGGAPYKAITYSTLSRSMYRAVEEDPANPLIIASIERGLPNCILFDENMPDDCVGWLRDWHNSFHEGSSVSFLELLKLVKDAHADWVAHADASGLKTRSCGSGENSYEARRYKFVTEQHPNKWDSRNHFEATLAVYNYLKDKSVYENVCTILGDITDFTKRGFRGDIALHNMHSITTCMREFDVDKTIPQDDIKLLLQESLKFCVPTGPPISTNKQAGYRSSLSFYFDRHSSDLVAVIKTPMDGSTVYKKAAQSAKKILQPAKPIKPQPRSQKSGAKSRRLEDLAVSGSNKENLVGVVEMDNRQCRQKYWIDDLVGSIAHIFDAMTAANVKVSAENVSKIKSLLYSVSLEFAFAHVVTFKNIKYDKWSSLRDAVQAFVREFAAAATNADASADGNGGDGCPDGTGSARVAG